jgi:hypothetical protein
MTRISLLLIVLGLRGRHEKRERKDDGKKEKPPGPRIVADILDFGRIGLVVENRPACLVIISDRRFPHSHFSQKLP